MAPRASRVISVFANDGSQGIASPDARVPNMSRLYKFNFEKSHLVQDWFLRTRFEVISSNKL